MQSPDIYTDINFKEITKHGTYDFPIAVYTDDFKLFNEGYIRIHWHKELQFSYVLKDKIIFSIEGSDIVLNPGDGIIINSNILHQIKPFKDNCNMFTINFDPLIISGSENSIIYSKYVNPFLTDQTLKYICLTENKDWQKSILDHMFKIFTLYHEKDSLYELEIINNIQLIWINLLKEFQSKININKKVYSYDQDRVKKALQYIDKHYTESIQLNDIASNSNISKSECCRSFRRILKTTPFEYLLKYRISKSLTLLKGNDSISNIALNVGFSSPSYFGKVFKKYMKCTPSSYRESINKK